WALGHSSFDTHRSRLVLSAATPVILHTASVRAMVDWLEHRHRTSLANLFLKPRPLRARLMQLTESSLYYTFLDREGLFDRYRCQSDLLQDVASQVWQAHSADDARRGFDNLSIDRQPESLRAYSAAPGTRCRPSSGPRYEGSARADGTATAAPLH